MKPVRGSRVVVSNPRDFGAGVEHWLGKTGRVRAVSGGLCEVVLDGEREALGFFAHELEVVQPESL